MAGTTAGLSAEQAARYDAFMQRLERRHFPDTRAWLCGRAEGRALEVAVGTGLNLPHYPAAVHLTGLDHNPAALDITRARARSLGRDITLTPGDAGALPFPDASFDTVVATFVLCEVPDDAATIAEALRVLRPGGSLLLVDHVVATTRLVRIGQRILEALTIPLSGEHFTRRPSVHLEPAGADVVASDRFAHGAIERVRARKR